MITYAKPDEPIPATDPGTLLAFLLVFVLFGVLIAIPDRRTFILGSLGALQLGDTRSFSWLSAPVLAIGLGGLAGSAVASLAHRVSQARLGGPGGGRGARVRPAAWAISGVTLAILLGATWFFNGGSVPGRSVLSADERAAMAWVADRTPEATRFVVVTGDAWSTDRSAEWFPVLARRVSVATPQGTEWLPNREFARRIEEHLALQRCGTRDARCLAEWARETERSFDAVYVADHVSARCCSTLRASLEADPGYQRMYVSNETTIFIKQ
jgi:hypothetical protein